MARRRKRGGKGKGKKVVKLLLTSAINAAAQFGLNELNSSDMMQQTANEDGTPAKGINIKKLAINGGVTVASGAGFVLVDNEWVECIALGISQASISPTVNTVTAGLKGLGSGMGNTTQRYLNLYNNNAALGSANEFPNADKLLDLAGAPLKVA